MKPSARLLVGVIGLAALAAAAWWFWPPADPAGPTGPAWFADITESSKLDFVHDAGPTGDYFMPQALGSGAALFDFDSDGRLDLYLLQNGGPKSKASNRLYRQNAEGHFEDVSAGSGLDIVGHNMGAAVGDVDNDGWPDLLVTQVGGVKLFRNQGDGKTFVDISSSAGVVNPAWATSAAFFDFDRDGWLDLVVVNYVDYDPSWPCTTPAGRREYCPPSVFPGRASKLFRNLGKQKDGAIRFEDVTIPSGIGTLAGPGLGVVCADFDGDGWPDIFIANDGKPNRLWMNQKNGTFTEEAVLRGVAFNGMGKAEAGMGVALGDADGDGLGDLFVTHLADETNTLWRQVGKGMFNDVTVASKLTDTRWRGTGFGVAFADLDNDGALDLAIANGRISKDPKAAVGTLHPFWGHYAERNQVLANDGVGRFRDVSPANPGFCGLPNVARGLAIGDLDGDGGVDFLVTTVAGKARLLKNVAPRGHWLTVRAVDPALKRDAIGAEIRVHAATKSWLRLIQPASSYLCSSDPRAHFGLGAAAEYDGIEVTWPDGLKESFPGGPANRSITFHRGAGQRLGGTP